MYDAVLRVELLEGVEEAGFADDIGVIVTARTIAILQTKTNEALRRIRKSLLDHHLELAAHKTEAVMLVGRRRAYQPPSIYVGNSAVTLSKSVRYLGVFFESSLEFKDHIRRSAEKTAATVTALSRIMPNLGGPKQERRKLLANVVLSQMLYGAEVWAPTLQKRQRYRDMLGSITRRAALRVICGYRTVSADAAEVLAGIPPIDLLAAERRQRRMLLQDGSTPMEAKEEARATLMAAWQQRWSNSTKGRWTWKLIPDIGTWTSRRHGQASFRLTQCLTGHGCFSAFLKKIGKEQTERCPLCGDCKDDAEHAVFHCAAYAMERWGLGCKHNIKWTPGPELLSAMLATKKCWQDVDDFLQKMMKRREELERDRRQSAPPASLP